MSYLKTQIPRRKEKAIENAFNDQLGKEAFLVENIWNPKIVKQKSMWGG